MVVPNSIGQNPTPTAAISTTCQSSNFSIFHLYDDNFDYNPNISNLSCTSTNPTAYQEKVVVDVDTGTNKIIANYPTVFYMEKDSQINFDISFFIFESYLMNISSTTFTITTSVSEINGMPPTNSATSTNNVGPLYVEQMFESNSLYTWTDGANNFWSSFNNNDFYSAAEYNEENENGIINIQQNYRMNQTTDKNLTLHAGSQINANFEVYYNGDSDSTDNAGPCQPSQTPNDCDWLNVTIYNDDKILHRHTEPPWPADSWKNIQFSFLAEEEDMIISENGGLNLSVELSMSVKGDYQDGGIFFPAAGTPGQFTVKSGGQIEFSLKGFAATDDDGNEAKGEVSMQIYQGESLGDALSMHTIAIELDGTAAPIHVDNFIKHVDAGNYDGTIFHRIIDNFMIQGGDFQNGDGTGGYAYQWYGYCNGQAISNSEDCDPTDYTLPDEANSGLNHLPCTISMAKKTSPNTGESQFFMIPQDSTPSHLDGVHTVFGKITSGCEAITMLSEVETGQNDRPTIPVVIHNATVISYSGYDNEGDVVNGDDSNEIKGEVSMQIYQGERLEDALSIHTITIELDFTAAPIHVDNFIKHVDAGNYNGAIFHRIIDDFMIQGGDFQNGDGTGGYAYQWYGYCDGQNMNNSDDCSDPTLYTLPDEADNGLQHTSCKISMAKTSQPNTGGSQFFIMPDDITHHTWLDGVHTVFGEVTSGCESITMLSEVETGQNDRPTIPVVIHGATVVSYPGYDTDGDGIIDTEDDFPDNPDETTDSDGDGVGDNADEFPFDANETHDDDGDGVGNNTDAFPQDANETHDDDGDGVGNNTDAFPQDADETMDTDGDGVGDNADPAPKDPTISSPADLEVSVSDTSAYLISGSIMFLALVIIFVRRRPPTMQASDKHSEHGYQESLFNEN